MPIEIARGNKNYENYLDERIVINKFIFSEILYWLIRIYGHEIASRYSGKYEPYIKDVDAETIKKAMLFRYKHKKQKLSMVDCISYLQAKELGIRFLTGGKKFENIEGVEFVK